METRAAVLHDVGSKWEVETIRLDPPKAGEVLVKIAAAGLCHSDEHLATGDMAISNAFADAKEIPRMFPIIGGHEGSGVVVEVGQGVTTLQPGDHVSTTFSPACGRCHYCSTGRAYLCDNSAFLFTPGQITDGTSRHWLGDQELAFYSKIGCFAEHTVVAESSLVKVPEHINLEVVALISCGVLTGWGSAVKRAGVEVGDTVVVMGCGGLGMNAVQGSRMAGARHVIAVETEAWKREKAYEFGATHDAASLREALPLVREITWGRGADRVICTPGLMKGEYVKEAVDLLGKGGVCVITAMGATTDRSASLSVQHLATWSKELRGCLYGAMNPRDDIPRIIGLYENGQMKLDELITRRYTLDEVNEGYEDLRNGSNIRGVLVFD
jgi:NDMA-dependent alcohol dehydrogenase